MGLKLLLATAQRRSEIITAKWAWVDFDEKTLTVPRPSVKNRREANIVPLSELALDLLEQLKFLTGHSEYLVPSVQNPRKHTAPQTVTSRLRESMGALGIAADNSFTPHDLHRTVATMLSGEEVQREHIKAVLNHSFGDVTETYINSGYVKQKRRYLDLWADKLRSILDGSERSSNVVPIEQR